MEEDYGRWSNIEAQAIINIPTERRKVAFFASLWRTFTVALRAPV